ncbi:hypothetical protein DL96DRAFT_1688129 [Flagelloscypha sp. PMI_526]|nr:hypothetical protein DL96DRAFT_1688129 [Flagelloscypha sp. PMI_526]
MRFGKEKYGINAFKYEWIAQVYYAVTEKQATKAVPLSPLPSSPVVVVGGRPPFDERGFPAESCCARTKGGERGGGLQSSGDSLMALSSMNRRGNRGGGVVKGTSDDGTEGEEDAETQSTGRLPTTRFLGIQFWLVAID